MSTKSSMKFSKNQKIENLQKELVQIQNNKFILQTLKKLINNQKYKVLLHFVPIK